MAKKLKLLVFSHISNITGGAELSMLDVLDHLAKNYSIEPTFVIRNPLGTLVAELEKRGWPYHSFDYTFWSEANPPKNPEQIINAAKRNSATIKGVEDIIENIHPDLVLTNSVVCPWGAIAAYLKNIPHVWFVREYGDLDHGRIFELGRESTFQEVDHLSDIVVANSLALQKHLAQYINPNKLTTLYTPFDIASIVARSKSAEPIQPYTDTSSLKLVITGSVVPSKGQLEVVEAVGRLNKEGLSVELCIVGRYDDKIYNKKINDAIQKYDIARKIHFTGFQTNPLTYVAKADVGIMTSRMEAFGRVTFEYIALGKPVVGARSGATPEMVHPNVNGFLYTPSDIDDLTNQIRKYASNHKLISKHGQASGNIALDMMKGDNNIDNFYQKLGSMVKTFDKNIPKKPPVHLIHHWLDYPLLSEQAIKDSRSYSFGAIAKSRLKNKIRPTYIRFKNARLKIFGK